MKFLGTMLAAIALTISPQHGQAALPTILTDRIYKGSGEIDLLLDITASELADFIADNASMYLGVDLNEAASGLESADSVGVAIADITMSIQTTAGNFSFSDFYTNTTANILAEGESASAEYYTLFGTAGSNQLNGSSGSFGLSGFDDVIQMDNIIISGDIISATMRVTFLNTAGNGDNETFFDYSAGFEEFAVLDKGSANTVESDNNGLSTATPKEVSFALSVPAGTPEPWWVLLIALPLIQLLCRTRHSS